MLGRISTSVRSRVWQCVHATLRAGSFTGIGRIRMGDRSLGRWCYDGLQNLLFEDLPDPVSLPGGMLLHHRGAGAGADFGRLYLMNYEPETTAAFRRLLRPGASVVDGGAHIGYFSVLAGTLVGVHGRVYSFEPDPANWTLLRRNVAANGLEGVVEPHNRALGGRAGTQEFFCDGSTSSSLFAVTRAAVRRTVQVTTLDEFLEARGWPAIDLLKLDVEGAEAQVLAGAAALLERASPKALVIELNPAYLSAAGADPHELLRSLAAAGYNYATVLTSGTATWPLERSLSELVDRATAAGHLNVLVHRPHHGV